MARKLPSPDVSMPTAVRRLEQISCAIYETMQKKAASQRGSANAYDHFREKAYKLLGYYVDNDLHEAFGWLAQMYDAAPKRLRGSVLGNDFHIGLLAMTAAAGVFMSPNKLRELAALMQQANDEEIDASEFNDFVIDTRRYGRAHGRS